MIKFMKFPALFGKGTQVRIYIYLIYLMYSIFQASANVKEKTYLIYLICYVYFIFQAYARMNKINIYIYI